LSEPSVLCCQGQVKQHLHILREGTGAEVKEFFGERCRFEQVRARRRRAVRPHAPLLRGSSELGLTRTRLCACLPERARLRGPSLQAPPRPFAPRAPRRAG